MDAPIFVIGATGTVGSRVVELLRERGVAVRATTRDAEGAPRLDGVQWVSLVQAGGADPRMLAGAAGLFLMAPLGLCGSARHPLAMDPRGVPGECREGRADDGTGSQ